MNNREKIKSHLELLDGEIKGLNNMVFEVGKFIIHVLKARGDLDPRPGRKDGFLMGVKQIEDHMLEGGAKEEPQLGRK